ncbi:hypothetical protein NPIL_526751 [Nephila pilipes]|uniref:HTH CENPB-type domain-containing protein n=1 Tax=Nephila pilipes TaxID=299642 RepID=A0A8X6MPP1_NEPPI|nr:hypothetical protein NPIL_526751 [Nephila pilipes]
MTKQIRALEERLHIIDEAKRLDVPPSTLNLIISKKREIGEQAVNWKEFSSLGTSRLLLQILLWMGIFFLEKALEIAASYGRDTFSASNEWISRFKIRHGDDDNADEEWLCVAEDVTGVK